jgi:hypothetical protein
MNITTRIAEVIAEPPTELFFAVDEFTEQLATELLPLIYTKADVDGTSIPEAREEFLSGLRDAIANAFANE